MPNSLRKRSFTILGDAVADVVGKRNLAYVAVVQAGKIEDESKDRWASSMFRQISVSNRKQIKTNAIEKAHVERARANDAGRQRQPDVVLADLGKLFGRPQGA
ncbi:hypothetical protein [Thalassobaculum sp.]|uniref:hypothetical protein n=1 Tax=Thalassobaculum sp. TaxID=2022740 RepID=UPI0032EC4905